MATIGFSIGDIAAACTILSHIIKAFDGVKGVSKQYRDSHAFLCGLYLVVNYISDEAKASSLPEDARLQIQTINHAYMDFHAYILKYAKLDGSDRSRLKTVLPTVRWSFDDLNNKVQKMKTNSINAIAIMETLIVMDLSVRVNALLNMGQRQEQSIETATVVLRDVREQLASLSQVSEEYKTLLDDLNQAESAHTVDMRSVETRLNDVSKSQNDLQANLDTLMSHLEERARNDRAQQQQWRELLESRPEPSIYDKNCDQRRGEIENTKELLGGVGDVTGDARMHNASVKVGGVGRLLGAMAPLSNRFSKGFGKSKGADSDRETSMDLVPVATVSSTAQKKTFKPAPPITTPPPPKREYTPAPAARPSYGGKKQYFSDSRSIPSKQLVKPLPPRRTSEPHQTWETSVSPVTASIPSTSPSRLLTTGDQQSAPALPPRSISSPATSSPTTSMALALIEDRPSLPPRRTSVPTPSTLTKNALVIVEAPPSLPVRNYTLSSPAVPDRGQQQQSPVSMKAPPTVKTPPKKPQHLSSRSLSVPTVQEEEEQQPSLSRVMSASSAASTYSATSLPSLGSSPSPISPSPSATPKAPHIAELIRALESKKTVQPPVPGSVRVPGMA